MATGRKPLAGKSQASLIAAILDATPPPISSIVPMTPPALDRVVKTCLEKDPDDRFQTAHDVRLQLDWIAEGGSQAGLPAPVVARRRSRERIAWIVAAVLGLPRRPTILYLFRCPAACRARPVRRSFLRRRTCFASSALEAVALGGRAPRPLDRFLPLILREKPSWSVSRRRSRGLAGTEGATFPFWPRLAFLGFLGRQLKKIDVACGPPCHKRSAMGGRQWNRAASSSSIRHSGCAPPVAGTGGQRSR